jgi:hypothetical protein
MGEDRSRGGRRGQWARYVGRGGVAIALGGAFVVFGAAPAGAHGLAGVQPTNFASNVRSVTPAVPGLRIAVRELGARIEVRNDTAFDALILGYQGEPYLRVGPGGVYENVRSPSVFLNRSQTVNATAPASYDAQATPEWRRTGSGREVSWHDHRVHWMGASEPPVVRDSPGRSHLVSNWVVELRYRGQAVVVRGDLRWVPGPSALPRLGLALLVAVIVTALGFTRRWGAYLVVTLAALAGIVVALVVGEWSSTLTTAGVWTALLSTAYSLLGIAVTLAAAAALVRSRREPANATAIVLVAAVILTFGSGLADITYLARSQLPTTLPGPVARTCVALVLGGSIGVLVTAARKLRRPALLTVPATAAPL